MKDIAAFQALGLPQEDFWFSAMVDEGAHKVLDTNPLRELLNQNISLSNYGSVSHVGFTPIAIQGDGRHQSIGYKEEDKSIDINLQLDYRVVKQATTKEEMTSWLARYLLAAIPLFAEVPVPHFQISSFRQDIFDLFQKQGWLDGSLPKICSPPVYLVWMSDFRSGLQNGKRPYFFARKVAQREWYQVIEVEQFAGMLNQRMNLTDYGSGVEELYLSFLADEPDGRMYESDSTYFREDLELHLSIPLGLPPYDESALVNGLIAALPEVKRWDVPDFDWERLKRDCKKR